MLDPEIKQKWLAALRGTGPKKYDQGIGRLRTVGNCYCCLGVLCDIVDPNGWHQLASYSGMPYWMHDTSLHYFPSQRLRSIGLPGNDGDTKLRSLAILNDEGRSFAEIADVVEKEF